MADSLIEILISQIKTLTEQNKFLTEQNMMLIQQNSCFNQASVDKIQPKIITKKELFLEEKEKYLNGNEWEKFVKNIKSNLIFEDIKFIEKGYSVCIFEIIIRILKDINHRPIYTFSKKNKVMVLFKEDKWCKINFDDFTNEIKVLINAIIHALICRFRKNISKTDFDEILVIMMEDSNKYKECISNKLIEYCAILTS